MHAETSVTPHESLERNVPARSLATVPAVSVGRRWGLSRLLLLLLLAGALVGLVLGDSAWITDSNEGLLTLMGLLWVGVLVGKGASRG